MFKNGSRSESIICSIGPRPHPYGRRQAAPGSARPPAAPPEPIGSAPPVALPAGPALLGAARLGAAWRLLNLALLNTAGSRPWPWAGGAGHPRQSLPQFRAQSGAANSLPPIPPPAPPCTCASDRDVSITRVLPRDSRFGVVPTIHHTFRRRSGYTSIHISF